MQVSVTGRGDGRRINFSPRRLFLGQNLLTATALGIGFGIAGFYIGGALDTTDNGNAGVLLGFLIGSVAFLATLGFANDLLDRLLARPSLVAVHVEEPPKGWTRFFGISLDHKVVGLQFGFVAIAYFFVAGFQALMIRTELMHPNNNGPWPAGQYTSLIGLHGLLMMFVATLVLAGTFGNYFVPLMIGAKRMALPRLESFALWMFVLGGVILYSSIFIGGYGGGFPTGWTGYQPLADEARWGMDSYIVGFSFIGVSAITAGVNLLTTIFTMRAPGMTWSRLPIFVWSIVAVELLSVGAPPVLAAAQMLGGIDRAVHSAFFLAPNGGTSYLYLELFWFFGHPEVYIFILPAFGIILEIVPVFARKRLFGYRLGVAGLLGITLMSWFVWNHHIFPSGIAPGLRPFFMTATEFISIPTSIVYLNFFGTIWRSKLALRLPLLFAGAALINFLIGGLSGVFLSDVPLNMAIHGTYFVIAHFHYTILGGEIFALYAASYYWFPKITGKMLNRKIGVVHLVTAMVFFNTTFVPMFAVGMLGMQRQVPVYIPALQGLNVWITINAYLFGLSNLIWLGNMVYSWMFSPERAVDNPWQSRTLEWQVRTPVPHHNFDRIPTVVGGPYDYDEGEAPAVVEVPPPTPEPVGTA